jgi:5'-nucleotidase/UDP-sugar diphosphatase
MGRDLRKLTLLHSNDMHGDFMSENIDDKLVGGVAMLSGYIDKVRQEEENVVYVIAGDMFRGSIIDQEYRGLSTIEIVNMLSPDVVTLGNHEVDYGVAHLLFIEKLAKFPIINSNLYIKTNHTRLFRPYLIKEVGGIKILYIGILTEEVIAQTKQETLIGSIVDVYEAAKEVGRICNAYSQIDIDFTILLTHIGHEEDKKLASMLDPAWGVDIIIGGHSHTFLEQPDIVNGIVIAQAGTGTDQIGRFDIIVDKDNNCIEDFTWQAVPIDETHCPVDKDLEEIIHQYHEKTNEKFSRIITRFKRALTHPKRSQETELGNLCADAVVDNLGLDIMLFASGSIRKKELGPILTLKDFKECFPFDDKIYRIKLTKKQIEKAFNTILGRDLSDHVEFYQVSRGFKVKYSKKENRVTELSLESQPLDDNHIYSVGLQEYHFNNMADFIGITKEEAEANSPIKVVTTSSGDVLEEAFLGMVLADPKVEGRIVIEY